MNFICQQRAVEQLHQLQISNRHSILIEGCSGSGKTYLAKLYADLIGIEDFQIIDPSVSSVRSAIEECQNLQTPIVLCIENIDVGVVGASYTLLKFLEEPSDMIYIIITARNINRIPDTIISRSTVISTTPPLSKDIDEFARSTDYIQYSNLHSRPIWKAVRSFSDALTVMNMTNSQIDYIEQSLNILNVLEPISTISWRLGHFDDNSEVPVKLLMNYIIATTSGNIRKSAIECSNDLSGRIANHAVLAKFLFDCKYNS